MGTLGGKGLKPIFSKNLARYAKNHFPEDKRPNAIHNMGEPI